MKLLLSIKKDNPAIAHLSRKKGNFIYCTKSISINIFLTTTIKDIEFSSDTACSSFKEYASQDPEDWNDIYLEVPVNKTIAEIYPELLI